MDLVENVGRRERVSGDQGDFIDVGLFSVNGFERNALYSNDGVGAFNDVAYPEGAARVEDGRGLGVFDADSDGDLDLVINNYLQPATLLINHAPRDHHWLRLKLVGTRSNRSAIGARVSIRHGSRRQSRELFSTAGYLSGQSLHLHFGTGTDERIDHLEVRWPSGLVQTFGAVATDRFYSIREGDEWMDPMLDATTAVDPRRDVTRRVEAETETSR
jgi:hypothetical protein